MPDRKRTRRLTKDERALLARVDAACQFPENTCGSSRHAAMVGEALLRGRVPAMIGDDPQAVGASILATVAALWEARTAPAEKGER